MTGTALVAGESNVVHRKRSVSSDRAAECGRFVDVESASAFHFQCPGGVYRAAVLFGGIRLARITVLAESAIGEYRFFDVRGAINRAAVVLSRIALKGIPGYGKFFFHRSDIQGAACLRGGFIAFEAYIMSLRSCIFYRLEGNGAGLRLIVMVYRHGSAALRAWGFIPLERRVRNFKVAASYRDSPAAGIVGCSFVIQKHTVGYGGAQINIFLIGLIYGPASLARYVALECAACYGKIRVAVDNGAAVGTLIPLESRIFHLYGLLLLAVQRDRAALKSAVLTALIAGESNAVRRKLSVGSDRTAVSACLVAVEGASVFHFQYPGGMYRTAAVFGGIRFAHVAVCAESAAGEHRTGAA